MEHLKVAESPSRDVVELTKKLVSFDTINPPGNEVEICDYLQDIFANLGLQTKVTSFGDKRRNLIATIGGNSNRSPIGITGHMDTVPLGSEEWSYDPFAGTIENGRIYGRGTCDMKGGVAAAICAVQELGEDIKNGPGVTFFITGGEETGSDGARDYAEQPNEDRKIGALIVAEPTNLIPLSGHKGVFWVKAVAKGKTAHGSMPEHGENAIFKVTEAIQKLQAFKFGPDRHEHLGSPSLNIGTISGGLNTNSVADHAEFSIDMRTLPGQSHNAILDSLNEYLGNGISLTPFVDLSGVWTDESDTWFGKLENLVGEITGEKHGIQTAPYFTDASVLTPYFDNVPTVILGPGSPQVAHITDEYCEVSELQKSVNIYKKLITDWYIS